MAPPPKSKPGKKAGPVPEEAPEQLLQAVVIADSFNRRFRPLTLEKPRCLLPLANSPIIEYTLEFLALSGVEEVFIFTSALSNQVEAYIEKSKWTLPSSPFQVNVINNPNSASVGDVMRELDQKTLIKSDFILVSGDIVCNVPLQNILEGHKERKAANKSFIMTSVLRKVAPGHRTQPRGENTVFVTGSDTSRVLHYEYLKHAPTTSTLAIPRELVKTNDSLTFQNDLLDCFIDIVSPDVPPLFTENFDWQHLRKDFLHGILMDELYGKTVHCHILEADYSSRIESLSTYDAVNMDVACRWAYPFCPDSNMVSGQTYKYSRGHIYKEKDVILARSAAVQESSIVGGGSIIGEGSVVIGSVIGRNCKIGRNVRLCYAKIWDDVVIEDNCQIGNSIVANNSHIGEGCTIASGAIVSFGVKLEKGSRIGKTERLTRFIEQDDSVAVWPGKFMADSYRDYEDSEDEEEELIETALTHLAYADDSDSDSDLSDISEISDEDGADTLQRTIKRHTRSNSNVTESESDTFHREAYHSLLTALERDHPVDVMILELNGLRMTANAEFNLVRRATASAVTTHIVQKLQKLPSSAKPKDVVDVVLKKLLELFNRMVFDETDQADFLTWFQRDLAGKEKGGAIMQAIGMHLLNEDIIEEGGLLRWWNDGKGVEGETPDMKTVREGTKAFIDWVMEEEEEESDEEEEEEDDDDDE